MTPKRKHPGYLTKYAQHAGISKEGARKQLARVGINYFEPFDFEDADMRRMAARHADRVKSEKPVYTEDVEDDASMPAESVSADPVIAESQRKREKFRAYLTEIKYLREVGQLVDRGKVEAEMFSLAKQVCDAVRNISNRVAGKVAVESDHRKVKAILDAEIEQALEALVQQGRRPAAA